MEVEPERSGCGGSPGGLDHLCRGCWQREELWGGGTAEREERGAVGSWRRQAESSEGGLQGQDPPSWRVPSGSTARGHLLSWGQWFGSPGRPGAAIAPQNARSKGTIMFVTL